MQPLIGCYKSAAAAEYVCFALNNCNLFTIFKEIPKTPMNKCPQDSAPTQACCTNWEENFDVWYSPVHFGQNSAMLINTLCACLNFLSAMARTCFIREKIKVSKNAQNGFLCI